jgi:hypothetical protein
LPGDLPFRAGFIFDKNAGNHGGSPLVRGGVPLRTALPDERVCAMSPDAGLPKGFMAGSAHA